MALRLVRSMVPTSSIVRRMLGARLIVEPPAVVLRPSVPARFQRQPVSDGAALHSAYWFPPHDALAFGNHRSKTEPAGGDQSVMCRNSRTDGLQKPCVRL